MIVRRYYLCTRSVGVTIDRMIVPVPYLLRTGTYRQVFIYVLRTGTYLVLSITHYRTPTCCSFFCTETPTSELGYLETPLSLFSTGYYCTQHTLVGTVPPECLETEMPPSFNTNNPAIRRIMREAREISEAGPNPDFVAVPQEDNIFEVRSLVQRKHSPKGLMRCCVLVAVAFHDPRSVGNPI